LCRSPTSEAKWSNPVGITERYDPKAREHGHACVRATSLGHEAAHGDEDVLLINTKFSRVVQIVGKDIEKKFRVGKGVDVPVRNGIHELQERGCVDQVSILWGVFSAYIFLLSSSLLSTPKENLREGAEDKKAHMSKRYAIWGIDVEWLSLRIVRAACSWITD